MFGLIIQQTYQPWVRHKTLDHCDVNTVEIWRLFDLIDGKNSLALDQNELFYVRCISTQHLDIIPDSMQCMSVRCREIHISFTNKLDDRRIALCFETAVESWTVKLRQERTVLAVLIKVEASCKFKVRPLNSMFCMFLIVILYIYFMFTWYVVRTCTV